MLTFLPKLAETQTRSSVAVSAVIALLLGATTYAAVHRLERSKGKQRPHKEGVPLPQPKTTLPLLGNTLDFIKNNDVFHDWISTLVQDFDGEPFLLTAPGRPDILVISTPEAFEDVTKRQFDTFVKGPYLHELFYDLMGDALTNNDGEVWRFQRKVFAKLFSTHALRESMTSTIQKYGRVVHTLFDEAAQSGESFDLFRLLSRFTMESFAEIGFGIQMGSLATGEDHPFERAFDVAQEATAKRFSLPVWFWKLQRLLGVGSEGQLQQAAEVIDTTVMRFISESIASHARGEKRDGGAQNIVSLVLDSSDLEGEADPQLLRSIVVAAVLAGRDTSAETMAWFIHTLSQNPEVERRIRAEMFEKIPKLALETGYFPSMDEVQSLTYLEAALKETLRLYPPASFNIKYCSADTFLSDGTFVPEGTTIGLPSYAMGRVVRTWGEDCNEYKPERFLDPDTGKLLSVSPFKFPAFFAGPRICVGMNLALLEMKIVLAGWLSRFHVAVQPGQEVTYTRSIALPMKNPFMVTIERAAPPVVPIA
jgi:cytochrome P450